MAYDKHVPSMKIREATLADKEAWDAFVEAQDGRTRHFFGWRFVVEAGPDTNIQLILENDLSQIIGTFQVIKVNKRLYSSLSSWTGSPGPLLEKDLSKEDQYLATKMMLEYLDEHYASRCSSVKLMDKLPLGVEVDDIDNRAILDCGYQLRYDKVARLPCSFIIELKPPFEQNIWLGLWSAKLRQVLRGVERSGVVVIEDKELRYAETHVKMLAANYRRHRVPPIPKEELIKELQVFGDRVKLFVALKDNVPIVTLCCHYTPTTCYLWQVGSYTKDTDHINKYTYKVAIENACNRGYRYIDFGGTMEPGLATLKERFRGTRVPMLVYEKRYSKVRSIMELIPAFTSKLLLDRNYLWSHRKKILNSIFRW
jgi:hypothetical protein